jgi:hypothetical protein
MKTKAQVVLFALLVAMVALQTYIAYKEYKRDVRA